MNNNHSTLEFSNTKEKMNAYQYDTLSQENQSVKILNKPNKYIVNRGFRSNAAYIKEVINENDNYDRGSLPSIRKNDKMMNKESSFSSIRVP